MLKRKLRSRRGETLTEILAAILVCGFSIMLLVGMITTSMRINSSAREMDQTFYQALSQVETHTFGTAGAGEERTCQVVFTGAGSSVSVSAVRYTQEGLSVYGEVSAP